MPMHQLRKHYGRTLLNRSEEGTVVRSIVAFVRGRGQRLPWKGAERESRFRAFFIVRISCA